jgi:hypothetical protein
MVFFVAFFVFFEKKIEKKLNVKYCVLLKKNFYLYKMRKLNTKNKIKMVWTHQGKKIKTKFEIVKIFCHKKKCDGVLGRTMSRFNLMIWKEKYENILILSLKIIETP